MGIDSSRMTDSREDRSVESFIERSVHRPNESKFISRAHTHFLETKMMDVDVPNAYFENNRNRDRNKRDFVFNSKRMNNSPYVVVKGREQM